MKREFLSGIVSGGLSFFVKTAAMLILTPLMIGLLGVKLYGAYLLFVGISELSLLAATGLTTGFIQNFSKAVGSQNGLLRHSLLISARWVYSLIALSVLFLGWLLMPFLIAQLFKVGPYPVHYLEWIGYLVVLTAVMNIFSQYLSAILWTHFLHKQTNVVECVRGILEAILAVIILYAGGDIAGVFVGRLVIAFFTAVLIGRLAWQAEPGLRETWNKVSCSFEGISELFRVSLFAMITKISVFVAHRMDEFIIAAYLTLTDVTCFGLVMRMLGQIAALMVKLSEGTSPFFARLSGQDDVESSRYLFLRSTALMHFMVCLLLMLVMFGFPEFLEYMGDGKVHLKQALPLALIACGTIWTGSIQIPASSYLFSSGFYRFQTVSTVITALCNLGLSIVFIKYFGLPGVILGTLIPHAIQNHFVTIKMSLFRLKISWIQFFSNVYIRTFPPLLVAGVLLTCARYSGSYLFKTPLLPFSFLLPLLALCGFVSAVVWAVWCLDYKEKELLIGFVRKIPFLQFLKTNSINS